MNSSATLFVLLFGFVAFSNIFLSVVIYLANRASQSHRLVAGLLLILGIDSIIIALLFNAISFLQAQPWLAARMLVNFMIAPILLLATIALVRPEWLKSGWLTRPISLVLIALPLIFFSDISGFSESILNTLLVFDLPNAASYQGPDVGIAVYYGGLVGEYVLDFIRILLYASTFVFAYVTVRDWRRNPERSRIALVGTIATMLPVLSIIFLGFITSYITNLIAYIAFSVGFTITATRYRNANVSLRGLPRTLRDIPMAYKLVTIVAAGIVPVVLFSTVLGLNLQRRSLINIEGNNLRLLAEIQAESINSLLDQEINKLNVVSRSTQLVNLITVQDRNYFGLSTEAIRQNLELIERNWDRPIARDTLTEEVVSWSRYTNLANFSELSPAHERVLVTDVYGGLVIATERTNFYLQDTQPWHEGLLSLEPGSAYISQPMFDPATDSFYVDMAVPIFADDNNEDVDGVLVSHFNLSGIIDSLEQVRVGESGGVALFDQQGTWVSESSAMMAMNPGLNWEELLNNPNQWATVPFASEDSVVAWEETNSGTDQMFDLGWRLATHKSTDEILATTLPASIGAFVVSLLILLIALGATVLLARFVTRPLSELTTVSEKILEGEFGIDADVTGKDEVGTLASTFNMMTQRLRSTVSTLEGTVTDRTQDLERRNEQLETAALVAREAAAIQNVDDLLDELVRLISDRFDYYHAGIFLLDERAQYAILRAANSVGGQKMLARGHRLQVGRVGVVGYSAGTGEPRIAQDVGADVVYYDNPDMPETRSELALPLKVRNRVIGVLDVQSEEANAFGEEDVEVLLILADQIALAIENTRLLQSSQESLQELEALYGAETGKAWRKRTEKQPSQYRYSASGINLGVGTNGDEDDLNALKKQITFRGQSIGSIDLKREGADWTDEEMSLVDEIIEQTGLALENARLMEQIRLRSDQIQLLQDVTATAASNLDQRELLKAITQKIATNLDLKHCNVVLFDEERENGIVAAWASNPPNRPDTIPLSAKFGLWDKKAFKDVIHSRQPLVIQDLQNDSRTEALYETLRMQGTRTWVCVPLIVREKVVGALGLYIDDVDQSMDEEDFALLDQISSQIATTIENTNLYEQAVRRGEREHQVAEITAKVRASNDPNEILKTAVEELRQALGVEQVRVSMQGKQQNDGNGSQNNDQSPVQAEDV
ncbi:MAG: GAF domain-containing protein [Chloroflexi bacterium]|nr:MAG: GAF domain-containing protein [Chloroflexota bacterium]MBL1194097.1 GAF domain-containing protein [Chloroflexota bacterium]NOH11391.1 GAF domain-containing protein [Chloroflexota bacterium]